MSVSTIKNWDFLKRAGTLAASLLVFFIGLFAFFDWDRPPFSSMARAEEIERKLDGVTKQLTVTNYAILILWENNAAEKQAKALRAMAEDPMDREAARLYNEAQRELETIKIMKENALKESGVGTILPIPSR